MPFVNRVAVLSAIGLLAGCGGSPPGAVAPHAGIGGARPSASVSDVPVKIGAPYTVNGAVYTPEDVADYDAVGYASWYGGDHDGGKTANGETLRAASVSAAHRTLPLPSYVEVTALDSGRTIVVRVNDRGPFSGNRIIDLSAGAAEQLGIAGAVPVRVRRVNPSEPDKALLRSGQRAPERIPTPDDLLVALRKQLPVAPVTVMPASPIQRPAKSNPATKPMPTTKPSAPKPAAAPAPVKPTSAKAGRYMVQLATFSSRDRADLAAGKLGASVLPSGNLFRIRLGPFASEAAARSAIAAAAAKGYPGGRIVANDTP